MEDKEQWEMKLCQCKKRENNSEIMSLASKAETQVEADAGWQWITDQPAPVSRNIQSFMQNKSLGLQL